LLKQVVDVQVLVLNEHCPVEGTQPEVDVYRGSIIKQASFGVQVIFVPVQVPLEQTLVSHLSLGFPQSTGLTTQAPF
jgi:hypothetical protein